MSQNLGQPVKNKHKVPLKQWNKWSNHARRVFNTMMYSLRPSVQHLFLHPDAIVAKKEHWSTTQWNVAWTAAEAVKGFGLAAGDKVKTRWVKRGTKRVVDPKREIKRLKKKAVRRGK